MAFARRRRLTDDSERYLAIYIDLDGEERSAGSFKTEEKALAVAQKAEERLLEGHVVDLKKSRQLFEAYVTEKWLPNHRLELTSRQGYENALKNHILPRFGKRRIGRITTEDVREWVTALQTSGVNPPTIEKAKVVLDAIFTTALTDRVVSLHPGRGVKTPVVPKKPKKIITFDQFERIYRALPSEMIRLMVETEIETGLRWGELTELRVRDLDCESGILTVARAVVKISPKIHPDGKRYFVKDYPKDGEWRQLVLAPHMVEKLTTYVRVQGLGKNDLFFTQPQPERAVARTLPAVLPDPETLGRTYPNELGRTYRHGTTTGYGAGKCRCEHCTNAIAAYRAGRRAAGKDAPRTPRNVATDGHISNDWFRNSVWKEAIEAADLPHRITPKGLRDAHASWLLAGGADVHTAKVRLGHGTIRTTEIYLGTLPGTDTAALTALDNIRRKTGASLVQSPLPIESAAVDSEKDQRIRDLEAKLAKFKQLLDD